MSILLYIPFIYSMIFPIHKDKPILVQQELSANTVVLVKTTLMIKNPHTFIWSEADEFVSEVRMKIYKADKESGDLLAHQTYDSSKYETHNEFVSNSYMGNGLYTFEFVVQTKTPATYGLNIELFRGTPQSTDIVSGVDYHMSWLTQKVGDLLAFARSNFDMEVMGNQDEMLYVRLYNKVNKLLFQISLLKIVVIFVTIFYVNTSVKKFFITQKIAK